MLAGDGRCDSPGHNVPVWNVQCDGGDDRKDL